MPLSGLHKQLQLFLVFLFFSIRTVPRAFQQEEKNNPKLKGGVEGV